MTHNEETRKRAVQQRSTSSKRRILDAAVKVLIEEGYAGATTIRIQREAQASRGGLLHHFPSRDELLVAAVHHLAAERVRDLGARTDWPTPLGDRIDAAVEAMWQTYAQPYFWASIELWVAARIHDELRTALAQEEKVMGSMVRVATANFFGAQICAVPAYPTVRELLNTSMRGVAMTYTFESRDPRTDPHLVEWQTLARNLLLSS
ncbi:TetR/AcrR family transcriptional regulator [Nocardia sp. NBC_01499]|uniref:TetR/AcrR family transcriptional regulator n=1 Tax=Nocardia sp. NBC_01499 TaxID=2903597 RepID=UPI0038635572